MNGLEQPLMRVLLAERSGDPLQLESAVGALVRALRQASVEDPLLAADCLEVLERYASPMPELMDPLRALAASVPSRSGRAAALVVDGQGAGHVVDVLVTLSRRGRGVRAYQAIERSSASAAQLAVAAALGPELERWGARWQVCRAPEDFVLSGGSIGLPLAVAARSALLERPVAAGWAFTGGVELDGTVTPVAGIEPKLRAAMSAGLAHVGVPAGAALRPSQRALAVPVSTLDEAASQLGLTPRPPAPQRTGRRAPRQALLVVLVLCALLAMAAWAMRPPPRDATAAVRVQFSPPTPDATATLRSEDGVVSDAARLQPGLYTLIARFGSGDAEIQKTIDVKAGHAIQIECDVHWMNCYQCADITAPCVRQPLP